MQNRKTKLQVGSTYFHQGLSAPLYCALIGLQGWMSGNVLITWWRILLLFHVSTSEDTTAHLIMARVPVQLITT